ncbi:hypothetical protein [Pararhizobium sp. IMCC21322]|uniref:hypothetical protein n=1 Tax=Pararhizobium sp. IMCC21322 TaxID=3067903 RepID=UPI002741FD50|nr:hypothetical protein [Pararhizobium sp. IMCC21322]
MKLLKRIQSDPQNTKQINYTGAAGFIFVGAVIGILAMLAFGGHMFGAYVQELMLLRDIACEALMQDGLILTILLVYMLLIAFPFVPGAEIGFALLLISGGQFAGALYLTTVAALTLSFSVGRLVPACSLEHIFARFGFARIAQLLSKNHAGVMSAPALSVGAYVLPNWINWLVRHRRCTLAVLINAPGNTLIGGGGGIALAAGVSRMMTFREFLISVSLAVAPVPLIVTLVAWFGG